MKIESPTDTTIGQFYDVPCLVLPFINQIAHAGPDVPHIPVQWPPHHDKELGVEFEHLHIDWRFVGKASYDALVEQSDYPVLGRIIGNIDTAKVELRRMKCKRRMPIFPRVYDEVTCRLQESYSGKCIDLAKPMCLHKAVDLRTAPIEIIDGKAVLVCPGHGLGWDAETGVNVARHGAVVDE